MIRISAPTWLAIPAVLIGSAVAALAEPTSNGPATPDTVVDQGRRVAVVTPVDQFVPHAQISKTLYVERCKGTCTIRGGGTNDARTNTSTIPQPGTYTVPEFTNSANQSGAAADVEWNMLMTCLKEVYSPFDVIVTDTKPPAGVSFHLALAAGRPPDVGLGNDILGVAPLAGDCSPQDNVISFSFANAHSQSNPVDRTNNICWTVAQESAHAFGLDHQYRFIPDGRSACNDPMTYRTDCGGQKFFRNQTAECGEFGSRACRCGANQNSHLKIAAVFGEGTPITAKPTCEVTLPANDGGPMPQTVIAVSGSQRGVSRLELLLNGHVWADAKGVQFGRDGQPESSYGMQVPAGIPNGNYDIVVRAYDDLNAFTDSATRTAVKGSPCVSADTCLKGQKCESGKCFWEPPAGVVGDDCTFNEFCLSGLCSGTAAQQICTQPCVQGPNDSCPEGLACVPTSANGQGVCFFEQEETGCCSANNSSSATVFAQLGFGAVLLGLVIRRRRRAS
ncbi:MAG: hypothetical protein KF773_09805 [Deltaproteobacteria bacterium]|nr:hypothetical protein [Deltaproteobacteria bacterium]MCW5801605.1 hypothetical protein [Deltaproteobacteria bacterium]